MRTGGLPGTYPDDRRAAAMPIATAAPPSWPVYRRHGPTPPAEAGSTKGATGRRQLPQSRNGGYRARRPPPCSCLGSPHTHHAAAVAAYRRACGKTTELRPEWKAQWISNGFSMDFQWIFNGFSVVRAENAQRSHQMSKQQQDMRKTIANMERTRKNGSRSLFSIVGGYQAVAKIARDRTRTEQQIAEAIIFNEKMMVSLERK